jgi:hypothetical protein
MPIHATWRRATDDDVRLNAPSAAGVYELKSFGTLIYVGKADDLKADLQRVLDDRDPNYYRWQEPELFASVDDLYDQHCAKYEAEHGQLPAWNRKELEEAETATSEDDETATSEDEDPEEPEAEA